jgi:tetratricopeptide (TPR) repeat protein
MEKLIELNPRNADALNYVAYGLADTNKDLARAETLIKQALEVRPSEGYYLDTLGWIQFRAGRLDEAQGNLEKAMSMSNEDIVVAEHYVEVLLARDQRVKAVGIMKAVLDRQLSPRELADQERVVARERLAKRLKELFNQYPELEAVKKSELQRIGPRAVGVSIPNFDTMLEGSFDEFRS